MQLVAYFNYYNCIMKFASSFRKSVCFGEIFTDIPMIIEWILLYPAETIGKPLNNAK